MKKLKRVQALFSRVRATVGRKLPFLCRVQIRICPKANEDHKKTWRLFAHTGHLPQTICIAEAMEDEPKDPCFDASGSPADASEMRLTSIGKQESLFDEEVLGILVHEFGHLAATALGLEHHKTIGDTSPELAQTPDELQMEADLIMVKKLDLRSYTYGARNIQWIDLDEFENKE